MLLTRSRHSHNNNNNTGVGGGTPVGGTPHSVPPHHHHHQSLEEYKKKYSAKSKGSASSMEKRCHFWSWIVCGLICSFLSIEYSIRSHQHVQQQSTTTAPFGGGYSDSILTPLQSLTMTNDATTTTTSTASDPLLPSSYNKGYKYDSLAQIKPNPNQHAILIPYRERSFHLALFLEYMGPWLHHHFPHAEFTLWVIEQDDTELFNRGWLANVGLKEIVRQAPTTSCVIFHDVDLVPNMTSHVPYTTCQYPMQLGSELQHFNWSVPYPAYAGGITTLSLKHWQLINGLGNDYIGWGGEDDDLYHRLRQNGLLVTPTWISAKKSDAAPIPRRPPKGHGVFRTISQASQHHSQKKQHSNYWRTLELLGEMHDNSDRWKLDGMSDCYYTITGVEQKHPALGIKTYNHIKAMPQKLRNGMLQSHQDQPNIEKHSSASASDGNNPASGKPLPPLEFVHVPYTGGQAITRAAAQGGYVWGACHYGPYAEWDCPPIAAGGGDFQHTPISFKASFYQSQRPWHIPLSRFTENPMEGTKRFTVVRHPYSRAISFYRYIYDQQHGYPYGFKYHAAVTNRDHPPLYVANYLRDREHPTKLNAFLQEFLIREHHPHVPDGVELIPQVNFVYFRGIKFVHHVLHYEFLQRDFKNLLEKYEMVPTTNNGAEGGDSDSSTASTTSSPGIVLPPPERKRKRKKQYVKKYEEKRVPKVTWTFGWHLVFAPIYKFLGWQSSTSDQAGAGLGGGGEEPVVDMSLSEIEDEYLLGAQDLAEETIAMLNTHFELDFKKFHYAKIKVNITADQYWNPIQIIPRESAVNDQQHFRNEALNKHKSPNRAAAAAAAAAASSNKPPATVAQTAPKSTITTPPAQSQSQAKQQQQQQQQSPPKSSSGTKNMDEKQQQQQQQGQERGGSANGAGGDPAAAATTTASWFRDRKKKLQERLNAKIAETEQQQQQQQNDVDPRNDKMINKAMKNLRAMSDQLRKEKLQEEQEEEEGNTKKKKWASTAAQA